MWKVWTSSPTDAGEHSKNRYSFPRLVIVIIAVADAQSILEQQKQALTPEPCFAKRVQSRSSSLLTGVALVIGMTSAVLVTRSITKGIAQVKQITNELSHNLNVEVNIESKNEIGELLTNMEITIESLRDIVGQVNRSSVRIGEMSESLNQGPITARPTQHSWTAKWWISLPRLTNWLQAHQR